MGFMQILRRSCLGLEHPWIRVPWDILKASPGMLSEAVQAEAMPRETSSILGREGRRGEGRSAEPGRGRLVAEMRRAGYGLSTWG